jgi:tetratricopeptide (TPR) repeat protein
LFEKQPSWGGGKRNATTISLAPLSTEEASRLLQVLLDRTLLPAETQAVLLERAGGNPLYAEQFARMLIERGDVEGLAVPETVQALMAARIDTLRPELKMLLHDAAVTGRIFWSGALAAIGERDRDEVRRDLNELVRREFVRPVRLSSVEGEDEFSFWHALVRDVAYQQIPRSPRAEKHLAAAAWVEATAEERLEDHAEILVFHYGQALDLTEAAGDDRPEIVKSLVRFLLLAGDRAEQLDTQAAEGYYRRAFELAVDDEHSRANAQAKLAGMLVQRGDVEEGIEAWETAIASLRMFDEPSAAANMRKLATTLWARGDMSRSRILGDEAVTILERTPGPELVAAYGSAAFVEALGGRFVEAVPLIDKGLAVAAELGVVDVIELLGARAAVRGYQGDPAALDDCREARDIGLRLGLGRATAVAMNNLADGTGYFVGLRPARKLWDEGIEFARARGLTYSEMWNRGERLRALYHLGDWDELREEADEVVRWEQGHGGGQLELFAHVHLANVLVHCGAITDAMAHVDALMPRARESGDPQVLVPGLTAAALVASAQGNDRTALEHVVELEEVTRETSGWRSYCLVWPARIAAAAGELQLAESFLDGTEDVSKWNACARLTARAMLAEAREAYDEASPLFRDAAKQWDEYGSIVERGYALLGLGRCGDAKALREGEAIFASLGASPVVARAA